MLILLPSKIYVDPACVIALYAECESASESGDIRVPASATIELSTGTKIHANSYHSYSDAVDGLPEIVDILSKQ